MVRSLPQTGALFAENVWSTTLENCRFVGNTCSGLVVVKSNFLLCGRNEIRGNIEEKGGSIPGEGLLPKGEAQCHYLALAVPLALAMCDLVSDIWTTDWFCEATGEFTVSCVGEMGATDCTLATGALGLIETVVAMLCEPTSGL